MIWAMLLLVLGVTTSDPQPIPPHEPTATVEPLSYTAKARDEPKPYRAQAERIVASVKAANDCLLPTGVEWWEKALEEQAALPSIEGSRTP